MKQRSFVILAFLTILAAVGAWQTTRQRTPETEISKATLFPGLAQHVNDIARIELKDKTHATVVALKDGLWVVESRAGYPALVESVKKAVLTVSDLKVLEPKTSNKELYPKLGVEDVETDGSTSKLMTLSDKNGKAVAALIIGKNRLTAGTGPSSLYVRKPNEPQALLVEGDLNVSADASEWIDKEVLNIDGNRISDVTVEQGGEKPVHVFRKEHDAKDLTLDNIPPGHKPKAQFTINSLSTALENLRMDDVVAKSAVTFPKDTATVRYQTFDGLRATAKVAKIDSKPHLALEFQFDAEAAKKNVKPTSTPAPTPTPSGTPAATAAPTPAPTPNPLAPEAVEKDVEALNKKVANWVYVLPDFKGNQFVKKLTDLAGPPEAEKSKTAKTPPLPGPGTAPAQEPALDLDGLDPHQH